MSLAWGRGTKQLHISVTVMTADHYSAPTQEQERSLGTKPLSFSGCWDLRRLQPQCQQMSLTMDIARPRVSACTLGQESLSVALSHAAARGPLSPCMNPAGCRVLGTGTCAS